jgi:exodeoxyribonuclease VII small subunit
MADTFDFNTALREIQEINRWFQDEDISLEEGLIKLKRGFELIKKCNTRIQEVENQFVEMKQKYHVSEETAAETPAVDDSEDIPF